jgi:hypothetical protein
MTLWSGIMHSKLIAAPALAWLVALPITGYATYHLLIEHPPAVLSDRDANLPVSAQLSDRKEREVLARNAAIASPRWGTESALSNMGVSLESGRESKGAATIAPSPLSLTRPSGLAASERGEVGGSEPMADHDRLEDFKSNPVRSTVEEPVSTAVSIDAETASYSLVRRSLREGLLPPANAVRVEEMINYFPYDWKPPSDASAPFNSTITVMPTPWNDHTKLMHIAIKGYDVMQSTLFPIAKDVKIQVEFNPEKVSEHRLIGYETRALNHEDFNSDRIDAGEIGSGYSLTAIYEIAPKGSPATVIDDLRHGQAKANNALGVANEDEYAFVRIRYKLPNGQESKLITKPVTSANDVSTFAAAGDDQRFSVAVAAFAQKLRDADQTSGMSYDRIVEIASAARGADPFGYRAEFLSLVRQASMLESSRR